MRKGQIELLSPAGDWDALIAAVESGADAVYLGMKTLNARRGAGNFDEEMLVRAAEYCHERARRIYVTVNTMVKQEELSVLETVAESLARAGADAAIVQDFGVARALSKMLPSLKLHASTQMAVHNRQGCELLSERGFERCVLAREMRFEEIAECAKTGIELEVFCHGALCVSTSGQCLFSSMVGGRSGNRGMCAQPCRLKYTLEGLKGQKENHLLSPRDLMTVELLDDMKRAGATSLKIEGRLKRPEYVSIVTGIYRRVLDGEAVTETDLEALRQIFNRGGFTQGYAPGIRDGEFISRIRPSHWGVKVGHSADGKRIRLLKDVLSEDVLNIRDEKGGETPVKLSGGMGEILKNPAGVRGDVMRLVSKKQMDEARAAVNGMKQTIPVDVKISLETGKAAGAVVTDGILHAAVSGWTVEAASKAPSDFGRVKQQLSKTGQTPYFIRGFEGTVDETAFVPAANLNALRRDALEALREKRLQFYRGAQACVQALENTQIPAENGKTRLVAECANAGIAAKALSAGADEIALRPGDIRRDALDALAEGMNAFFLSLPPVCPGRDLEALHDWALRSWEKIRGVYISNIGQLQISWPGEIRFDYSMNIANNEALAFLNAQKNVYSPSVELTAKEISRLGGRRELIVYGRIPLMHLRHCPLNAALGGAEHAGCHRCDKKASRETLDGMSIRDRMNVSFPLKRLATAQGCVIDVLNSVPVYILSKADRLPAADGFRMLFTTESAEEAFEITRLHRAYLDGQGTAAFREGDFTTGHYFRPVE